MPGDARIGEPIDLTVERCVGCGRPIVGDVHTVGPNAGKVTGVYHPRCCPGCYPP